ncbi:MAG: hypothetical protein WDM91_14215 [Rhizomicrobium sp.]
MILRAIFWVGLISLLMPHEPDLGFGRPGVQGAAAAATTPASIGALIQAVDVKDACAAHKEACAGNLSILEGWGGLKHVAVRSIDEVRADLAANSTRLH